VICIDTAGQAWLLDSGSTDGGSGEETRRNRPRITQRTQITNTSCTVPVPMYWHFSPPAWGTGSGKLGGECPRSDFDPAGHDSAHVAGNRARSCRGSYPAADAAVLAFDAAELHAASIRDSPAGVGFSSDCETVSCRRANYRPSVDIHFDRYDASVGEALIRENQRSPAEPDRVSGDLTQRARVYQFRQPMAFLATAGPAEVARITTWPLINLVRR